MNGPSVRRKLGLGSRSVAAALVALVASCSLGQSLDELTAGAGVVELAGGTGGGAGSSAGAGAGAAGGVSGASGAPGGSSGAGGAGEGGEAAAGHGAGGSAGTIDGGAGVAGAGGTPPDGGPGCNDDVENGLETDVDCGGLACPKCKAGEKCTWSGDCESRVCSAGGVCEPPRCNDLVKNGVESDVDCGGSCPARCPNGDMCSSATDCAGGACTVGVCYDAEVCLDGIDNDGDGAPDCADSECTPGHVCVDEAPPTWTGYSYVRVASYGNPGPPKLACPGGADPDRLFVGAIDVGQCNACACGAHTGGTCGVQPFICSGTANDCTGGTNIAGSVATAPSCSNEPFPASNGLTCRGGTAPVTTSGSCPASGGGVQATAPWTSFADTCAEASSGGTGCGAGRVCLPRPPADYQTLGTCISKPVAGAPCPTGFDPAAVAYASGMDNRGCSACQCTPNTTCTGGRYQTWDSPICNTGPTYIGQNQCVLINYFAGDGTWSVRRTDLPTPAGSCAAIGGVPTGSIAAIGPVTYCCQ